MDNQTHGFAKTWIAFQVHFRKAQKSVQDIRGPKMQQARYQQVNMLAGQPQSDIHTRNTEVVTMLHNVLETCSHGTPALTQSEESGIFMITTQQADAVVNNNVQLKMLKLLQQISNNIGNYNSREQEQIGRTIDFCYYSGWLGA